MEHNGAALAHLTKQLRDSTGNPLDEYMVKKLKLALAFEKVRFVRGSLLFGKHFISGEQIIKWTERKDTGRKAQSLQRWKYYVEKQRMNDRAAVEIGKSCIWSQQQADCMVFASVQTGSSGARGPPLKKPCR